MQGANAAILRYLRLGRQDVGIDFGGSILEACKANAAILQYLGLGRQDVGIDFGGPILEACKAPMQQFCSI